MNVSPSELFTLMKTLFALCEETRIPLSFWERLSGDAFLLNMVNDLVADYALFKDIGADLMTPVASDILEFSRILEPIVSKLPDERLSPDKTNEQVREELLRTLETNPGARHMAPTWAGGDSLSLSSDNLQTILGGVRSLGLDPREVNCLCGYTMRDGRPIWILDDNSLIRHGLELSRLLDDVKKAIARRQRFAAILAK